MPTIHKFFILVLLSSTSFKAGFGQMNQKYFAKVGGIDTNTISKKQFIVQQGIICFEKINSHHWEPILVDSYRLLIIRDTSIIFQYRNKGNKFEKNVQDFLPGLQSDDTILIYNILALDYWKNKIYPSPLEYKIKK